MSEANRVLTDHEREALFTFLADGGLLRSAIEKFADCRAFELQSSAAQNLLAIPRQIDLACDYAARASVYREIMDELEKFAKR